MDILCRPFQIGIPFKFSRWGGQGTFVGHGLEAIPASLSRMNSSTHSNNHLSID